ncbi:hypothetical protein SDC9_70222 [bioreactor metagenome]|uniref:Uncharacterized protein n=1 Tax=bioreactor metagenome TaxID=1076179 RepID=A0A644Y726_9ZZZZ
MFCQCLILIQGLLVIAPYVDHAANETHLILLVKDIVGLPPVTLQVTGKGFQ